MALDSAAGRGAAGNIYDLGYRRYEGAREGRSHAIAALFVYSFRAVFGFGRSTASKIFPIGLAVIALVPAAIRLGIAAIAPANLDTARPEQYFVLIQIILTLFCAVVAPEIIGRDQRNHVLPLYFSRALSRFDYVAAKAFALTAGLFLVCLLPQVLLLAGQAVAAVDLGDYLKHHLDDLAPIVASCALVATVMASMSLAIASQTPRRALATGAVLAFFVIFGALGGIIVGTTTGDVRTYSVILSPFDVLQGAVYWIFSASPPADSPVGTAGTSLALLFAVSVGFAVVALVILFRRYQRMAV
ncbi:MAG TPA: ABC transporter permease subunit [Dehalococcoidia bacterium]